MTIEAFAFDAYGTLYDPQSVAPAVEAAFPGQGTYITYVWRQKQLEYSWQRAAMGAFADFGTVTREALAYAVATVLPVAEERVLDDLCSAFDRLALFADAVEALPALAGPRLAILSNGSAGMLSRLLRHGGIADRFEAVVSSDDAGTFKPAPAFYQALLDRLGLPASAVALVSGNGFDLAGARRFGLRTIRIERLDPAGMRKLSAEREQRGMDAAFAALRSQMDGFFGAPDAVCGSMRDLVAIAGDRRA